LAIDRQLQCVSPTGVSCSVARTIASTFAAAIDLQPFAVKALRHAFTVAGETPASFAMRVLAKPSAAINNTRAR